MRPGRTQRPGLRRVAESSRNHDPGYDGTAVMIGKRLVLDRPRLPETAGVLTPATGIGEVLAARLAARGFTVDARRR